MSNIAAIESVEVEFGPPPISYDSLQKAVAGAETEYGQDRAKADTARIGKTIIAGGVFGDSSCLIAFANGWNLTVEAINFQVEWKLQNGTSIDVEAATRKKLLFGSGNTEIFDPNEMLAEIIGSEFIQIAITGRNVLVYTRANEIFWFGAWRNKTSNEELLHVCFET